MCARAAVAVVAGLLMTACSGSSEPGFTRDDGEAVRQIAEDYVAAFNAHDVEGVVALFSGTAVFMPPNSSTVRGRESIGGFYETLFSEGESEIEVEITEVGGEGALGFASGTYLTVTQIPVAADDADEGEEEEEEEEVETEPEMMEVRNRGTYISVVRKLAGAWLIDQFIWNSDLPLPEPPPPAESEQ